MFMESLARKYVSLNVFIDINNNVIVNYFIFILSKY